MVNFVKDPYEKTKRKKFLPIFRHSTKAFYAHESRPSCPVRLTVQLGNHPYPLLFKEALMTSKATKIDAR